MTAVILNCASNGLLASRFFYTVAATIRTAAGNKTKYKRSLVACNLSVQCVTGKLIHSLLYVLILQSWMVGLHQISHDLKGTSGTQILWHVQQYDTVTNDKIDNFTLEKKFTFPQKKDQWKLPSVVFFFSYI